MRRALGLALLLLLPVAGAQPPAWTPPDFDEPITYHVDTSNLTALSWWYRVEARQAFTYWQEGGNGALRESPRFTRVDDQAEAEIRFWFRDDSLVGETCGNSTKALGCARYRADGTDIEVKMRREDGQLYAYRLVGDVAAHEVGHALGLPHSNDPRDIMFHGLDTTSYAGAKPISDPLRVVGQALLLVLLIVVLALWLVVRIARDQEEARRREEEDEPSRRSP